VSSSTALPAAGSDLEFEPISTLGMAEHAVLALVDSIRRSELDDSDRLPNLPELSESLGIARDNARRLGISSRRCPFVESDWYAAVEGHFDLVVSNPPYVSADEPWLCWGENPETDFEPTPTDFG